MAKKQTSQEISSQAGRILSGGKPAWMPFYFWEEVMKPFCGSLLSQDETPVKVTGSFTRTFTTNGDIPLDINLYPEEQISFYPMWELKE